MPAFAAFQFEKSTRLECKFILDGGRLTPDESILNIAPSIYPDGARFGFNVR
jgi:hypothetical protein